MMHVTPENFDGAPRAAAKLPGRPDDRVLNESIPLFFIGHNKNGLWVAREAGGQTGGMFLFRESALRFAGQNSLPSGCAMMFLSESLELDVKNGGNPLAVWLDATLGFVARLIPPHPPEIRIGPKRVKGEWR
jgi:hypothetical protein